MCKRFGGREFSPPKTNAIYPDRSLFPGIVRLFSCQCSQCSSVLGPCNLSFVIVFVVLRLSPSGLSSGGPGHQRTLSMVEILVESRSQPWLQVSRHALDSLLHPPAASRLVLDARREIVTGPGGSERFTKKKETTRKRRDRHFLICARKMIWSGSEVDYADVSSVPIRAFCVFFRELQSSQVLSVSSGM